MNLAQEGDVVRGNNYFMPYLPNIRGDNLGRGSSKIPDNISQFRGGLYNPIRERWPPGAHTNSDKGGIEPRL